MKTNSTILIQRARIRITRIQDELDDLNNFLDQLETNTKINTNNTSSAKKTQKLKNNVISTDIAEGIAKSLRYWKRPMTTQKIWEIMKRRGYTTSKAKSPSTDLRKVLQEDARFIQLQPGRYSLAPTK